MENSFLFAEKLSTNCSRATLPALVWKLSVVFNPE